jgi:chromosome segregation ATPase
MTVPNTKGGTKKPDASQDGPQDTQQDPTDAQTADTSTNDGDQTPGPVPYSRFKEVNEERKNLQQRIQALEAAERKRQEDADKAEQQRLEEQNKFEELAQTRKAKVDELTSANDQLTAQTQTLQERVTALEAALAAYRDKEIEGLPDSVKALLAEQPVEKQLEWLAANKESVTKLSPDGVPPSPKPDGKKKAAPNKEVQQQTTVRYRSAF